MPSPQPARRVLASPMGSHATSVNSSSASSSSSLVLEKLGAESAEPFEDEGRGDRGRLESHAAPTYLVGPGDKLEIEIFNEPDTREATVITPDGQLFYSALEPIPATGLTLPQLKSSLTTALLRLYRHPSIGITLLESQSQRINVIGRVNTPGSYPLTGPLRLLDAITLAGGLSVSEVEGTTEELADLSHSFVKRRDQLLPVDFSALLEKGDISQNIPLEPGDFICLPSTTSAEVYVLGNVHLPRPIPFKPGLSVLSAYGAVQGSRPGTNLEHVTLVRGSLTQPSSAKINLAQILRGRAPDVALEPGDILYVAPGGSLPATYLQSALDSFTRTIGASEGPHNYPAAAVNATALGLGSTTGSRLISTSR